MSQRQHIANQNARAGRRSAGGTCNEIDQWIAVAALTLVAVSCFDPVVSLIVVAYCALFAAALVQLTNAKLFSITVPAGIGLPAEGEPRLLLAMEGPSRAYAGGGDVTLKSVGSRSALKDRVEPEYLPPDWLSGTRAMRQSAYENALHRGLDILASLALLLLTLPLLLVVALAIKLDSRGPIFYRQERVGRDHRVFTILKFRSMTVDAEKPGAAVWARVGDSRVTRVGRIIRHYRIDEIPQALNILSGDMSFVGPRPERPGFVKELTASIPHYADRAVVRPGLTGWAQVSYPYGASVEDARNKLAYDMWYIQKRSIWLDLRIILATVRVVLGQVGAR